MIPIRIRYLKENDAWLPPEERRVEISSDRTPVLGQPILPPMVPGDDPIELRPASSPPLVLTACPSALAVGGTVEHTHTWSYWDRVRFGSPWLGLGLALGAITDGIVRWCLS